jgi:hypothetical protein
VLFDWISIPEQMSRWVPGMSLRRIQDSELGDPNGLGSKRLVTMIGLVSFEETIVAYERPHTFEYSITRGSPVKNQRGRQHIMETSEGCHLRWHITYEPHVRHTGGFIGSFVENHFRIALKRLAKQLRRPRPDA